ncbi:TcpQ domain-containing protein [Pseudoalteromonas sp. G4]|uniref:TcpQ domain-containing protein n=1 Tax=Pseudoalteromonas sp. G4 TaxID=2992761 RepID=UPI00237D5263|nr:TcpQ domain-containing protein [Pseudoalteromonas sp. G4]MDE3272230.1 toxin co-regulated pilus biosynthesis Q family protein [Pseudoalteromonas sp. G4]
MWFWIKHLSLGIILVAAALYLLLGKGPVIDTSTKSNPAAEGLSNFYNSFRSTLNSMTEREKYVILLGEPEISLAEKLKQRSTSNKVPANWRGEIKARRFDKGETLKEVLSEFAEQEGIEFLWYLDKDYIIKDNFRVDETFITTLYQVSKAIDSDFENDVFGFFCYKHGTAVITENPTRYVRDNCVKATL